MVHSCRVAAEVLGSVCFRTNTQIFRSNWTRAVFAYCRRFIQKTPHIFQDGWGVSRWVRPSFSGGPLAAVSRKVRMLLFTFSLSPPACGIVSVPGDGIKFRQTGNCCCQGGWVQFEQGPAFIAVELPYLHHLLKYWMSAVRYMQITFLTLHIY